MTAHSKVFCSRLLPFTFYTVEGMQVLFYKIILIIIQLEFPAE
jgi:hypothetical protein